MSTPDLDEIFGALADPRRRAVLGRLAQGPATAGQLAELFPVSRAAVSQHLAVLRRAGLVRTTPAGRQVWYALAGGPAIEAGHWLTRLAERWSDAPTLDLSSSKESRRAPARHLR
jgi:DNA-binding transcriptional ArsR family regulator